MGLYFVQLVSQADSFVLREEAEAGRGPVVDCFFFRKTLNCSLPSGFCDFYLLSDTSSMMNIPGCCWKEEIRACQSLPSSELKLFCASPEV